MDGLYDRICSCSCRTWKRRITCHFDRTADQKCCFNKTFYEVYNADDGRAWRWPAQTWNAIAYISLLLSGVFGLKKDIEGIWFEGFIPTVLSEIRIFNLRYVNMCLDVSSEGEGKIVKMTLDGVEVKKIFWNLQGHHKVKLICRKED